MLTPIELMKATVDKMAERGFGRVVNITSGAVKAPIDILGLSNGARSGLTGFVAGLARSKLAGRGVTINGLLPGAFDTDRLRATMKGASEKTGKPIDVLAEATEEEHPGAALRQRRGVRRDLRVPLQRAGRLHHRPEPAGRRRRLPGDVLAGRRFILHDRSEIQSVPVTECEAVASGSGADARGCVLRRGARRALHVLLRPLIRPIVAPNQAFS